MSPRWRWWLFCAALWLYHRSRWEWAGDLMAWCVLDAWLGEGAKCGEGPPW